MNNLMFIIGASLIAPVVLVLLVRLSFVAGEWLQDNLPKHWGEREILTMFFVIGLSFVVLGFLFR